MRKKADLVFSLVVLLLAAWMVWQARQWQLTARLFPFTVGLPAIGLALLQCGFAVRRMRQQTPASGAAAAGQPLPGGQVQMSRPEYQDAGAGAVASAIESAYGEQSEAVQLLDMDAAAARRRSLEMSAWIVVFAAGVLLLGFRVSAALLPPLFLKIAAHERWRTSILLGLTTYLLFYAIFVAGLHMALPPGQLAEWFGLDSFDSYAIEPLARLLANLLGGGRS